MNITERKRLRQRVRNTLGVSRDPAPGTEDLLRAARDLQEMFRLTSGYGVNFEIIDRRTAERMTPTEALGREVSRRRELEEQRRITRLAEEA